METGGAQKSLCDLISRLDRRRFEPVLFCSHGADWTLRPELANVELVTVWQDTELFEQRRDDLSSSLAGVRRHVRNAISPVTSLSREIRRQRIDIVHTNTLKAHLLGGLAARLAKRRLIWHVRDILPPGGALTWMKRGRSVLKPQIIAISQAVADQFGGNQSSIAVIHNGVSLEKFQPGEPPEGLRNELGLTEDARVLSVVGRLTPWKGHETLLNALQKVAEEFPQVCLLIVGESAFWDAGYGLHLQEIAHTLGLEDNLRWLGFREDIPEILRLSEVFVLPSVNEPFGRVLIEAMGVACPVIATNSGGAPEVVEEGVSGLLVKPGDETDLAHAILQLLKTSALAKAMGEAGMIRARQYFDVNRVVAQVQELYLGDTVAS